MQENRESKMDTSRTTKATLSETAQERAIERDLDIALVKQVQEGNIRAFDQLIKRYRERLYSVVYNVLSNREDAADITQEAFIKAFKSIDKFKGNSSFFTWIYRIAVNAAITHSKKRRWKRFFSFEVMQEEGSEGELIDRLASESESTKSAFLGELQEKLNEALQTLSINHRTVVVLHEVEGLSHQEIADIMGCSEGTVRSRLHYAKQQLQSLLQDYIK